MKDRSKIVSYIVLTLGLVIVMYPFIWMIFAAFKPEADLYVYPPKLLPSTFVFDNFGKVFRLVPFGRYYLNSAIVTAIGTIGQVGIAMLAAYALARLDFPGKNVFYVIILSTMLMPFVVTMIPTFIIVGKLKLLDKLSGVILPTLFSGFSIIFLRQFFMGIPKDLEDSAKIDGCGYFQILFHVVLPNAKEGIATITLFSFLAWWREYLWPLIVINSPKIRTLPIGLKYLISDGGNEYNLLMAASLMAIVPVVVLYLFLQKQIVQSVTLTGIKS